MIQHIHIENFRCFDELEVEGFGRVNLITGLNNTGKTALLEAIYVLLDVKGFTQQLNMRGSFENDDDILLSLIKDRNIENKAVLSSKNIGFDSISIINRLLKVSKKNQDKIFFFHKKDWNNDGGFSTIPPSIAHEKDYVFDSGKVKHCASLIFDKKNQYPTPINLAAAIDNAELRSQKQLIIDGIRSIDASIDDLRTFASKPDVLFLQRAGKYAPIDYFGDAVQKMIRYLCTILEWSDTPNAIKYLLIDEIENGLHYTVQEEFWRHLFTFAKRFDVQIFATCHSLEMLKAFAKVADTDDFRDEAVYIEMARHFKTKKILALPRKIESLNFGLSNNSKIRGEV